MAVTCEACGHWSLSGEHQCSVVLGRVIAEELAKKQVVIQLPDKPGPEYDDLLIALQTFLYRQSER